MIKNVYSYAVMFITLIMMIGGGVVTFSHTADLLSPPNYHQNFEDYKMRHLHTPEEVKVEKTESELKEEYEQNVIEQNQRQRERTINQLIKSLGWIVIPLPIFIYTKRKLKEE